MLLLEKETEEKIQVIHPLADVPEAKLDGKGLGLMKMSLPVRFSLTLLRGYLIVMSLILAYHVLDLAGMIGHKVH